MSPAARNLLGVEDLEPGIRRATFRLPFGIDHVHCYFLRSSSGGWILVDTGLGARDPEERWRPVLAGLDAPVERIVVTHMHPDHVGGARDAAELTGAPVLQGRDDYAQCVRAWGERTTSSSFVDHWLVHGMPADEVRDVVRESERLVQAVHWVEGPEPLDAGDEVDGWRVEVLRGHADGHIVLLRAFAEAREQLPSLELEIAGRGPLEPALKALVRELGIADSVHFLGQVSPIQAAIERAAVVVVPSMGEGFGMAALEAMERSRPVIAADVGGLGELVRDGETGLLVPAGEAAPLRDAILKLAGDLELAREMGAAGRRRALSRFLQSFCTERTELLYEGALDRAA